jgi:raffinose/stachyose/melibiose transport system permease protein
VPISRWLRSFRKRYSILRLVVLCVLALIYLYPILVVVSVSIRPEQAYLRNPAGLPTSITLTNLRQAWDAGDLGRAMINSLIASSIGTVLSCSVCALAAFWFLLHRSRLAKLILVVFGSMWVVPLVIYLVPLYVLLSQFQLVNSVFMLGVAYGALTTPGALWLVWAYQLRGVPAELLEAGEVAGANRWQQFSLIALPLSKPILGAVAALSFIYCWSDLLVAVVFLSDPSKYTVVPAAATLVTRYNPATQQVTSAAVITILPSVLVFVVAQKAIVRGITAGVSR